MKKIVWIYGITSGLLILGISALVFSLFRVTHVTGELLGYLVMIISLSLIFVAVKQYRDKHLGGVIRFGKAFLVGLYITLIASFIYVAQWELYMQSAGSEEFVDSYQSSIIESMKRNGASQAEIDRRMEEHAVYKKRYSITLFRILITASEIMPVGLIISLISASLLKNSNLLSNQTELSSEASS